MTVHEFETTRFYKDQPAVFDSILAVKIIGVDFEAETITVKIDDGAKREVGIEFVELLKIVSRGKV